MIYFVNIFYLKVVPIDIIKFGTERVKQDYSLSLLIDCNSAVCLLSIVVLHGYHALICSNLSMKAPVRQTLYTANNLTISEVAYPV